MIYEMSGAIEELGRDLKRLSFLDMRKIGEQIDADVGAAIEADVTVDAYFYANVLAEIGQDIVRETEKRDQEKGAGNYAK